MALRRILGCLGAATLVLALSSCKDKEAKTQTTALDGRCAQLARVCGDQAKHIEKITAECNQAAIKQTEKGCIDKAKVAYDCYESTLCGGADKVWALDDFRVLADRHKKCIAERDALRDCSAGK